MNSPYYNKPENEWASITDELVSKNPVSEHIVDLCLKTWQSILNGKINSFLNLQIKEMTL